MMLLLEEDLLMEREMEMAKQTMEERADGLGRRAASSENSGWQ